MGFSVVRQHRHPTEPGAPRLLHVELFERSRLSRHRRLDTGGGLGRGERRSGSGRLRGNHQTACEEPEGDEEPYQHGVCASNLSHGTSSCHGSMDESTAPAPAYQRRVPEAMPALSTVLHAGRDVLGYLCMWTGTQWTCGCRDSACTQSYWQIQ